MSDTEIVAVADAPELIPWDVDEIVRTWAGDVSIDSERHEAILRIAVTTEERIALRIPREKLEGLLQDFEWARRRLAPWPDRYPSHRTEGANDE